RAGIEGMPGMSGSGRRPHSWSPASGRIHRSGAGSPRGLSQDMRLALIASFLLVTASRAAAQPGTVAPLPAAPSTPSSPEAPAPPAPPAPAAPTPPPADGDRDEVVAVMLSLGGTAASWAALVTAGRTDHGGQGAWVPVAAVSALLAPTFGHWYAGTPLTG